MDMLIDGYAERKSFLLGGGFRADLAFMQKCRNAEMQKCRNAEMQKCRNAEMQKFYHIP
ncbi:MAG: hypothetical protein LBG90_04485 [Spirochaetaceae bacterium]|jgi:hypothetical protein|nr:hypothetical protein [Spirochaetaceae bacterium]